MADGKDGEAFEPEDEDHLPEPRSTPVPSAQAREQVGKDPQEEIPDTGLGKGGAALERLTRLYPCTRFFGWLANANYPQPSKTMTRFGRYRAQNPQLYKVCICADLFLVFASALLLLTAIGVSLFKSLWLGI